MKEIEPQQFSKLELLEITPPKEGPMESPILIDKFHIDVAKSFPPSELSISSKMLIKRQTEGMFIKAAEIPLIKMPSKIVNGDLFII
jgi:hypothetical protein